MTMNWGYKLFFTFIIFAILMSWLVYRAFQTDFQLVEKEYYKSELRYQEVIDGTNRVNALASSVSLTQEDETIILQLPDEMKNLPVEGTIWFYCAYDGAKDIRLELKPGADGKQQIASAALQPGTYTAKIQWKQAGKDYYSERKLTLNR
jgi:nitrogen fixation protein FixH